MVLQAARPTPRGRSRRRRHTGDGTSRLSSPGHPSRRRAHRRRSVWRYCPARAGPTRAAPQSAFAKRHWTCPVSRSMAMMWRVPGPLPSSVATKTRPLATVGVPILAPSPVSVRQRSLPSASASATTVPFSRPTIATPSAAATELSSGEPRDRCQRTVPDLVSSAGRSIGSAASPQAPGRASDPFGRSRPDT